MAITLTIEASSANTDSNYTQRLYDDVTSWGSPARAEYALYMQLLKKEPNADSDTKISVTQLTDPLSDSRWTVDIDEDGWYQAEMLAVPIWDNSTSYASSQIVYHNAVYYVANTTTTIGDAPDGAGSGEWDAYDLSVQTNFDAVADATSTYGPTTTVYVDAVDDLPTGYSNRGKADLFEDAAKTMSDYDGTREDVFKVTVYLEAAKAAFARNRYAQADKKISIVTDIVQGRLRTNY